MIPKECKRLSEVDFPIAKVSAHSAREKSIRHGHPSTFHLWWVQRTLRPPRFSRRLTILASAMSFRWTKEMEGWTCANASMNIKELLS